MRTFSRALAPLMLGALVVGCADEGLPDRPAKPVQATMTVKVPGMT